MWAFNVYWYVFQKIWNLSSPHPSLFKSWSILSKIKPFEHFCVYHFLSCMQTKFVFFLSNLTLGAFIKACPWRSRKRTRFLLWKAKGNRTSVPGTWTRGWRSCPEVNGRPLLYRWSRRCILIKAKCQDYIISSEKAGLVASNLIIIFFP